MGKKKNGLKLSIYLSLSFHACNFVIFCQVPNSPFTILDKGIKDGVDYHTLSYDRRDVDLDDLTAPAGYIVVRKF